MADDHDKTLPLAWDPEYAEWRKPFGDLTKVPIYKTVLEFRRFNDTFMRAVWSQIPAQPTIKKKVMRIASYDGTEIGLTRFATIEQLDSDEPQPAWLYIHGGGMIAVSVEMFAPHISKLAADSGMQIFGVEYRLAPEHPDPVPVEDCYAALRWVVEHAAELNIDPKRLGLIGDSAGGGLAAGTSLLARDRELDPPVARQMLIYPMLDDRTIRNIAPQSTLTPFATLPLENLTLCWQAYVGEDKAGLPDAAVSTYAAPSRATNLSVLPATYMDVGSLDLFRDECAVFAERLVAAGVDVEFHMFAGVPHGFESAWNIGITKRAVEFRLRVLKSL